MYEEVVLKKLNKNCNRKFDFKIILKFKNNSMCSIEMKPLCHSCSLHKNVNLTDKE